MSLSRAFTTRKGKTNNDLDKLPQRASTIGKSGGNARPIISAPVQLVHTTNMLSYNAPNIYRGHRSNNSVSSTKSTSSPNSSTHTKSDDDSASQTDTLDSTPPTSPDVSAERCPSPGAHRLSDSFLIPPKKYTIPVPATIEEQEGAAPAIPKRSPSHTKKNSYEAITRQRSTRLSKASGHSTSVSQGSNTFSRASSTSTAGTSVHHISAQYIPKIITPPTPPMKPLTASLHAHPEQVTTSHKEMHPFGQELGQLSELAEEYGASPEMSEDDHYMYARELQKWSASEYLGEITSLYGNFFPEALKSQQAPLWI